MPRPESTRAGDPDVKALIARVERAQRAYRRAREAVDEAQRERAEAARLAHDKGITYRELAPLLDVRSPYGVQVIIEEQASPRPRRRRRQSSSQRT